MKPSRALYLGLNLRSCSIRHWSPKDADALQRYANNRKIWENLRDIFPHPYSLQDAKAFLDFVTKARPVMDFAITNETEAIGCIGLRLGNDVHRHTAELGFWLGEPFWGRGIMTEAVTAFTPWAFRWFELLRIFAQPFASNTASVRVLEKSEFACEGRLKANVLKNEKLLDSLMYARVREPPVIYRLRGENR
jgi:ribosomal-protein-alanine N-acetyltransferase